MRCGTTSNTAPVSSPGRKNRKTATGNLSEPESRPLSGFPVAEGSGSDRIAPKRQGGAEAVWGEAVAPNRIHVSELPDPISSISNFHSPSTFRL